MKYLLFVRHNEETFSTFSETKQGMLAESVQLNGISQDQQEGLRTTRYERRTQPVDSAATRSTKE